MIPFIKEGTFLHKYMEYMSVQETPREYDFACGLWCLSVIMGRSVVVDRPRAPVHLNIYMILVSESGILRKSSSIRAAVGIVRSILQQSQSKMLLIESKVTMGMLLNELSRSSQAGNGAQVLLVASELAAMLGRGTQIAGIPALLTDLYDCPDERIGGGSLSTGSFNLRDVYCSFLAGSTPSWLATAVRPEIVAGGFTSRCYFIHGRERKKLIAWPEDVDDRDSKAALVGQLNVLAQAAKTYSRIGISVGAKDTYTRWYEQRRVHRDTYRESFESREDSHVLRLAGLMAVNEQTWEINDDHIRRAITLVAEYKRYGTDLFTGTRAEKRDVRLLRKLRTEIIAAGNSGISRGDLYRRLNLSGGSGMEMRAIITVLHELDLIKIYDVQGVTGRPKQVLVATDYLRNDLMLEEVANKLGME